MKYIFIFLYFVSLLVSIDGCLKKLPAGRFLVEKISSGTTTFFEWRANSNVKEELAGIKYFFGWTSFSLFVAMLILAKQVSPSTMVMVMSAVAASLVIWYSFSSFLDIKKQIKSWSTPIGFVVLMPWFYALMKVYGQGDLGFFDLFFPLFNLAGVESSSIYIKASFVSAILLFGACIYFFGSMLVLLTIPGFIYILLKFSVSVSQKWGVSLPTWLYAFFVLYYVVVTMYFFVGAVLWP